MTLSHIRLSAHETVSNRLAVGRPSVCSAPWEWSPSQPRAPPASVLASPLPERSASWLPETESHRGSVGREKHTGHDTVFKNGMLN